MFKANLSVDSKKKKKIGDSNSRASADGYRDLTIRQRRRPWKLRWKTEFKSILNFFAIIPIRSVS